MSNKENQTTKQNTVDETVIVNQTEQELTNKEHNANAIKDMLDCVQTPEFLEEDLMKLSANARIGKRKRSLKWLVAACLGICLFVPTSVYAGMKLWSFVDFYKEGEIPDTAKEIINKDVDASEVEKREEDEFGNTLKSEHPEWEDVVSYKVIETVCDENMVYITFEATVPKESNYILIGGDCSEEEDVGNLGINSLETIKEYCKENEKELIQLSARANLDDVSIADITCQTQCVDGYKVEGLLKAARKTNEKQVNVAVVYKSTWYNQESEKYELIAEKTQDIGMVDETENEVAMYGLADGQEQRIGDTSIFIEKVTLTNTPIATYAEFDVRNEDLQCGNDISIHVVDDNKELLNCGPSYSGTAYQPDKNGCFRAEEDYQRMEELPDHIWVRAYNLKDQETEGACAYIRLERME